MKLSCSRDWWNKTPFRAWRTVTLCQDMITFSPRYLLFLHCSLRSLEGKGVLSSIICTAEVFDICLQGLWGRRGKERGFFFLGGKGILPVFNKKVAMTAVGWRRGCGQQSSSRRELRRDPSSLPTVQILPPRCWERCHSWIPHSQNSPCAVSDPPAAHTVLNKAHFHQWGDAMIAWNVVTTHTWSRCWCSLPAQEARARRLDSSTDLVFFHKCIPKCLNGFSKILE